MDLSTYIFLFFVFFFLRSQVSGSAASQSFFMPRGIDRQVMDWSKMELVEMERAEGGTVVEFSVRWLDAG